MAAAAARSYGPYHRLMFRHINGKTAVSDELLRSLGSDWSTSSLRPLTHTHTHTELMCVCESQRAERERIAGHNPSLLAVCARPAGTERVHGGDDTMAGVRGAPPLLGDTVRPVLPFPAVHSRPLRQ